MKRLLALVLVLCMLVPFGAFAATEEVSKVSMGTTSNVYIEGYADTASVSIVLRNSDATDVAYVGEVKTDLSQKGKYVAKFKVSGNIDNYGIYVRDNATGADVSESVCTAVVTDELYTASLNVSVDATGRTYIEEGDALNVSVDIANKYGDNEMLKVLVAAYDDNNKLLLVKNTTVSAAFDDFSINKTANTGFIAPTGTKKAKVFIWNDTETLIPVAPSKMVVNKENAITVHLAGDSLCTNYSYGSYPQYGWGQVIGNYFAEGVNVNNQAIGGWSSFTFLYKKRDAVTGSKYKNIEGSPYYTGIISKIQPGDYVMISFGINDIMQTGSDVYETADGSKRYILKDGEYREVLVWSDEEGTATVAETGIKKENFDVEVTKTYSALSNPEEYKDNLRTMINLAKDAGATPILMSSTGHYKGTNVGEPILSSDKLDDYFVYMEKVAEEENVEFIDLFNYTDAIYKQWGNLTRMDTVQINKHVIDWFKENDPDHLSESRYEQYVADPSKYDQVHYNYNGAIWVASNIAKLIYESDSPLAEFVNEPDIYDIPMQWNEREDQYRKEYMQ